eukprot:g20129.t1
MQPRGDKKASRTPEQRKLDRLTGLMNFAEGLLLSAPAAVSRYGARKLANAAREDWAKEDRLGRGGKRLDEHLRAEAWSDDRGALPKDHQIPANKVKELLGRYIWNNDVGSEVSPPPEESDMEQQRVIAKRLLVEVIRPNGFLETGEKPTDKPREKGSFLSDRDKCERVSQDALLLRMLSVQRPEGTEVEAPAKALPKPRNALEKEICALNWKRTTILITANFNRQTFGFAIGKKIARGNKDEIFQEEENKKLTIVDRQLLEGDSAGLEARHFAIVHELAREYVERGAGMNAGELAGMSKQEIG